MSASHYTLDCMACFDKVASNAPGYDYAYCVGNLAILFTSLINAIILMVMLVWHLLDTASEKTSKDTKTLIYVLLIGAQIVVALDYTFVLSDTFDNVVVIVTFNLVTFGFLAVCYYFIEGASKLLDEATSIMRFMKIFTTCAVIAVVANVAYISWAVYQYEKSLKA